jgi:hypothetical protein
MRFGTVIAVIVASAVISLALAGSPAQAAKKKQVTNLSSQTIVTPRQRSRIIVRPRRSYLDAGTEVLPGERKFTDYALPPYYSAFDVLGPGKNFDRQPLNSPWGSGGVRGW